MAKKINQFAQVVHDIRKEIKDGQLRAAKVSPETMPQSMRRLEPETDPVRQTFVDNGFNLTRLRKRRG